jgi:prepilin-type processing-associated H-X9-DG protein
MVRVPGPVRGYSGSLLTGEDKGMENRRIQAFSRVEMVVVAVCAALVLFVTLPSLTGAREAGKRAICLANLKTLGAGMLQYAQDYEGKIPCWGIEFEEIGQIDNGTWYNPTTQSLAKAFEWGYIWEYVQNRKPFVCPALNYKMNPKPKCGTTHSMQVWGWPGTEGDNNPPGPMWSYCVNGQAGLCMDDMQWRVNPELVMPSPKTVFMLLEADFNDYASYDNSVVLFNSTYDPAEGPDSMGDFHMGAGNLVFFDGHVDTMQRSEYLLQVSTAQGTIELCGGYMRFYWYQ